MILKSCFLVSSIIIKIIELKIKKGNLDFRSIKYQRYISIIATLSFFNEYT